MTDSDRFAQGVLAMKGPVGIPAISSHDLGLT